MAVANDTNRLSGHSGSLPSEIFVEYKTALVSSAEGVDEEKPLVDYEEMIQSTLSALAAQKDLIENWQTNEKEEIPNWLWKALTTNQDDDAPDKIQPETPEYEWWMGTRLIHSLLSHVSPFEIHSVASQSIVFTDGSRAHWSLCLLLCIYALRQCPNPIQKRWKRWQSLVCETIRLFQNYGLELGDLAVPLWIQHLLPACQQVIQQLPPEAYHIAFLASLVGTTSTLVVKECERPKKEEEVEQVAQSVLSHVLQLLEVLRTIVSDQGNSEENYSEMWVFLNPWRIYSSQNSMDVEQCEEVDFLQHQNDITWWNQSAHRHERVAGMDTAWDDLGISLLALFALENRPMVFTSAYVWRVWFPHVEILFKTTGNYPFLEHLNLPIKLLETLCDLVPEKSLPATGSTSRKPDSPFETFQLLSNRLVVRKVNGEEAATKDQELESKRRTEKIVGLMKSLLSKYQSINQVKIIKKLVHDCPHPGLQAKFMDLLRPVIFDEEAHDAFWTYINSFIQDLLGHMDEEHENLLEVDDLVEKVEIYVGAVTMIQLWVMVKGRLPKRTEGHSLGHFYHILETMIKRWMSDSLSMPPDDYYRLYLLEGSLLQVEHVLGAAKQDRKNCQEESPEDTAGAVESSLTGKIADKSSETPSIVVGDADIFI